MREARTSRSPTEVPITRECYIGPTRAKALEECKAALQYKYGAYSSWGLDKQSEGAESFNQPFEEFVKDRFIIGDKAFVKDEIQRYTSCLASIISSCACNGPGSSTAR